MESEQQTESSTKQIPVKVPASVFRLCPRCGSSNLTKFEGEVFCNYCAWDSVLAHEECRQIAFFHQRKKIRAS